ncbi:MAG: YbaB/EbfC family nucleoid-associated protein [Candidatus Saganbacteria bacterium]|nr:YbaB/EbfC family nucleoid-associated protein [Candidatus Saganbacteria bacterium]
MIFGDMAGMMKRAREMQEGLKKVQDELKSETYEASSRGVSCVIRGDLEIKEIKIDPNAADIGNVGKLEKIVTEVVSKAFKDAKDSAASKLKKITGGLSIPGLF